MLNTLPALMIIEVPATTICLWALISSHGLLQSKKLYLALLLSLNTRLLQVVLLNWVGLALFFLELNIAINCIPYFYYDNISANYMIVNSIFHGQTKHIKIDFHFVQKNVVHKTLVMGYAPSVNQLVNYLTKALPVQWSLRFRNKLIVITKLLSLWGGGLIYLTTFRFWLFYPNRVLYTGC